MERKANLYCSRTENLEKLLKTDPVDVLVYSDLNIFSKDDIWDRKELKCSLAH